MQFDPKCHYAQFRLVRSFPPADLQVWYLHKIISEAFPAFTFMHIFNSGVQSIMVSGDWINDDQIRQFCDILTGAHLMMDAIAANQPPQVGTK